MKHECKQQPKEYIIEKEYSEWTVYDSTYKYMDKLKYCPFCGKMLTR